jgi:hypothetical protein
MKKSNILRALIVVGLIISIIGCASGYKTKMRYNGFLSSGEAIEISFFFYFKDQASSERALTKNDKFIHALNLMFNSYKKTQLSKPRINNILKKSGNMIFDNSVLEVEVKSIKYRN